MDKGERLPKVNHGPKLSLTVTITGHARHSKGNYMVISHFAGEMLKAGHNMCRYIQNVNNSKYYN